MSEQTPNRILSLDLLRGVALLGILLMNIQSFTMPGAAYLNPLAFGDLTGGNYGVWLASHVLADQKFMAIFSMLFGAGMLIFTNNLSAKGKPERPLHFRRMGWLLLFGLIHGYVFWYGDILFSYALCGFILFFFRNRSVRSLLIIAGILLLIGSLLNIATGMAIATLPEKALAGILESWKPESAMIAAEIAAYHGGFFSAFAYRWEETLFMQTYVFLTLFVWRATGMMLLGMALYKSGFFSLQWTRNAYLKLIIWGAVIGFSLIGYGLMKHHEHAFHVQYSMFIGNQFNYWGSVLIALSYASIVMLWVRSGKLKRLQQRLCAVGKMAFSNYILQTLIGVFFAIGLSMFGDLSRMAQLGIVLGVWALQLLLSPVWLQHFRYGPLEWVWRGLTYWKAPSFRK